jgi:hypothetical protein
VHLISEDLLIRQVYLADDASRQAKANLKNGGIILEHPGGAVKA